MKKLLFVRHAESEANVQTGIIGGRANHVALTEKGIEQARIVGKHLSTTGLIPQVIYRSPAVRTMQTAEHALGMGGIKGEVYIHDGLQEMSQGSYEGMDRAMVYTSERVAEMNRIGKTAKLPGDGAESMTEVGERMYATATEIAGRIDEGATALVFGHGLAIRCLASHIEDWSREKTFGAETPNTSLTQFSYDNNAWSVDFVGTMPHAQPTLQ